MNDEMKYRPDQQCPAPLGEEVRLQRKKAAQELFDKRLRDASIKGAVALVIPPELFCDSEGGGDGC